MKNRPALVSKNMYLQFILLTLCFAAWGTAANMTDPLVKVFSKTFSMSALQAALVQFAYYGAYFCLAIPAAMLNKKFSYKTGVLTGLGCAAIGAFMFYPASQTMTYSYFLAALFILAGGLSILETSANPYVMCMGSEQTATRRLNLAQAFNPVGTNVGVFLAATLILPNLDKADAIERSLMSQSELKQVISHELSAVMTPYVGMACILVIIWLAIAFSRAPASIKPQTKIATNSTSFVLSKVLNRLYQNRHYRFGVIAQFFNVGAQTCVWTFTIQYTMKALGGDEVTGGEVLQYSMILFLLSRFIMTWLMGFIRPAKLLLLMTSTAALLSVFMLLNVNLAGVVALVLISACLSLVFPTIYALALKDLGEDTKFGAAGLVMAIVGGAVMSMTQAWVIDHFGIVISFVVPAGCFLMVAAYALFDLTNTQTVKTTKQTHAYSHSI
ncbi:L-fucose:H+ symporter permease [Catenovulum sp. 2E275]|uniref:L-fucose:H+ symporter permease n=1 Tax=Catenovulum sp. 2E275 TaxID=2980497 RepID=UPI0021CEEDD9|nr:L-fucose:H+ symporter permease [Catenovulum sp. 2E275]MCU4675708.1 L-fucose:H+ symporter permease [Catenovulum sp. 2E275]